MSNWSDDTLHKTEMKRRYPVMRSLYNKYYQRRSTWVKVIIPNSERQQLEDFALTRLQDKLDRNDHGYTKDNHKTLDRGLCGIVAERAMILAAEEHGVILTMNTDIGPSEQFNVPDFPDINTGCKAAKIGNIPVMFKNIENTYPQCICLVDEQDDGSFVVYILGVAYPKILNDSRNRSDDGIIDPRMIYKKTAFIGTRWLTPWTTYINRVKSNTSCKESMAI